MELKIDNYIRYYNIKSRYKRTYDIKINPNCCTCLVGPNGTGKTTMLKQIKAFCIKNNDKYEVISYNNLLDGGHNSMQKFLMQNRLDMIVNMATSSEGEGIVNNIAEFSNKCGRHTNDAIRDGKDLVILLDSFDSGMSIDNLEHIKKGFFNTVIEHCKSYGINVYIIYTSNSYELVYDADCIYAKICKRVHFKDYNAYRIFILKNSKD